MLQFSEKYPTSAIIVELKSKTLPPRLLAKMTELCDQEAKKFLGKPQVCSDVMMMTMTMTMTIAMMVVVVVMMVMMMITL